MSSVIRLTRDEFNCLSDVRKHLESGQIKEADNLLELVNPLAFQPLQAVFKLNISVERMIKNLEIFTENVQVGF